MKGNQNLGIPQDTCTWANKVEPEYQRKFLVCVYEQEALKLFGGS